MPEVGAACTQCKLRKVRCSLSLGRKRGSEWILDSDEEETGSNDQPKVKRPKTTGLQPSVGPVSVQVPERTSSVLDRLTATISAQNVLQVEANRLQGEQNRILRRHMLAVKEGFLQLRHMARAQSLIAEDTGRMAGWNDGESSPRSWTDSPGANGSQEEESGSGRVGDGPGATEVQGGLVNEEVRDDPKETGREDKEKEKMVEETLKE